jgi:sigma-B regulation protein RsbU (phosphoserine phosphatase)
VGIRYSEREILAPLRRFQLKTLLLGLATLLLMAGAIYLVTHRLTRPLTALARASDQIARGELDAPLPRARGRDEVARLVNSFTAMKRDLQHYVADLEEATASRSRLEGELNAAREIQMSLLPGGGEANVDLGHCALWARVRPARTVGGDLYCYFSRGNRLWIAVGDVSDKGVPAALFMAKAISLIPQLAGPDAEPEISMTLLNDALEQGNDNCMFVTLFLGALDRTSGELCFASAGHTPPSLLRGGDANSLPQDDGPALGLAPGLDFPRNTLQLQPGDRLAIFTDGIDEAFNTEREMFGLERFNHQLTKTGAAAVDKAGPQVFEALDHFAGAQPQSDDISLLLLQMPQGNTASRGFPRGERLTTRAQEWLQEVMDANNVPADSAMELQLTLEEIITNVDKYSELKDDALIQVTLRSLPSQIELEIADEGKAFDPLSEGKRSPLGADIDHAGIGGLGVHLITQLTDQQSYQRLEGRNVLRVVKLLASAPARDD